VLTAVFRRLSDAPEKGHPEFELWQVRKSKTLADAAKGACKDYDLSPQFVTKDRKRGQKWYANGWDIFVRRLRPSELEAMRRRLFGQG
jgi:hypothetical protein